MIFQHTPPNMGCDSDAEGVVLCGTLNICLPWLSPLARGGPGLGEQDGTHILPILPTRALSNGREMSHVTCQFIFSHISPGTLLAKSSRQ
jgi:hypothetical protein